MGRKLRRVPLDFNWPLDEVWRGFLNPYWKERKKCSPCDGSGHAPDAKRFSDEWYGNAPFDPVTYGARPLTLDHPAVQAFARRNVERDPGFYMNHGESVAARSARWAGRAEQLAQGATLVDLAKAHFEAAIARETERLFDLWKGQWSHHLIQADVDALVAADRLWNFTRVPRTEEQRAIAEAKVAAGGNSWLPEPGNGYTPSADEVNTWAILSFGHDVINQGICIKARCEREGVEVMCPVCDGDGDFWPSAEAKAAYDAWTETEPPVGDGYQLWETVSEGSPISPVFPTAEAFIAYLMGEGYSRKAAEKFVEGGWAPSGAGREVGEFKQNIHALDLE